ncbi:MAG TPA: TrkA family potassium uptake protein [Clostridiales bacterium]|nr:TrkA family potassium uptake protein [Clostridiales bacterium]
MKQYAVIGLGRFGFSIATTLYSMGHDVLVIDKDEEKIQEISDLVTHAIQADATDETVLKAVGIRNFDVVAVTIGSDIQASILVTLLCKEQGVNYVVAKAQNELHAKVLYKVGADKVILPEHDMGLRVAHNLVSSNILDYIELDPNYSVVEIEVIPKWIDKTLKQLDLRAKYGVNVMAIKHGDNINISPGGNDMINQGDILVVIGKNKDIERIEKESQKF